VLGKSNLIPMKARGAFKTLYKRDRNRVYNFALYLMSKAL
jgi:hypothetical protein